MVAEAAARVESGLGLGKLRDSTRPRHDPLPDSDKRTLLKALHIQAVLLHPGLAYRGNSNSRCERACAWQGCRVGDCVLSP